MAHTHTHTHTNPTSSYLIQPHSTPTLAILPRPTFILPHPPLDSLPSYHVLPYPNTANHILPCPTLDTPAILPWPTLSYLIQPHPTLPCYPVLPYPNTSNHILPCPTQDSPAILPRPTLSNINTHLSAPINVRPHLRHSSSSKKAYVRLVLPPVGQGMHLSMYCPTYDIALVLRKPTCA